MRIYIILLIALLSLTGCRDDEAAATAARAAKAAKETRIEREVSKRVFTQRQALSDHRDLLHTIRVVGFVVLAGGAVSGLTWVRRPRVPSSVENSFSPQQEVPAVAHDHYPVPSGRVLDLQPPSAPRNQPGREI